MSARVGARKKKQVPSGRPGGGVRRDPQRMWAEGKGRLRQVFGCRDRDETGPFDLEERKLW